MKVLCAVLALLICGCSLPTGSAVVTGTVRPAINPGLVRIYAQAPAGAQQIAMVEAASTYSWSWTDQGKTDDALRDLKAKAAQLGANGIVMTGFNDRAGNGAVLPVGSAAVVAWNREKVLRGVAIYVPKEG